MYGLSVWWHLEWDCRLDSWEKALVQPAEYLVEFYSFISFKEIFTCVATLVWLVSCVSSDVLL